MGGIARPFSLEASAPFAISVSDMKLATDPAGAVCPE